MAVVPDGKGVVDVSPSYVYGLATVQANSFSSKSAIDRCAYDGHSVGSSPVVVNFCRKSVG